MSFLFAWASHNELASKTSWTLGENDGRKMTVERLGAGYVIIVTGLNSVRRSKSQWV